MISRKPFWPPSDPPDRNRSLPSGRLEIVAHDQDVRVRQLEEPDSLPDRSAAQVHECLGLKQHDPPIVDFDLGGQALELSRKRRSRPSFRQAIDQVEADVVAGALVLGARVAQAYDEFHRRQGRGPRHATSRPAAKSANAELSRLPGDHER